MAGISDSRQYLASRVMPGIFEALRALDAARPNDPLNFIATELESHSIQGMHNDGRLPKAGGNVDMFAYTNGVVRDALLQAIRSVAVKRPREPLKAIAEELRSLPAWSAANWSSQSRQAARTHSTAAVPSVQVPQSRTISSAEETPWKIVQAAARKGQLTSSAQHLATDSELRSTTSAASSVPSPVNIGVPPLSPSLSVSLCLSLCLSLVRARPLVLTRLCFLAPSVRSTRRDGNTASPRAARIPFRACSLFSSSGHSQHTHLNQACFTTS